jgi:hypothetical protein
MEVVEVRIKYFNMSRDAGINFFSSPCAVSLCNVTEWGGVTYDYSVDEDLELRLKFFVIVRLKFSLVCVIDGWDTHLFFGQNNWFSHCCGSHREILSRDAEESSVVSK